MEKLPAFLILILAVTIGTVSEINIPQEPGSAEGGHLMDNKPENLTPVIVKNLGITVTYDNNPYAEGLSNAWGFSCLIRGTEKTILFDTGGNGTILLANMKRLGINPGEIDIVVLSHIHRDHIGGLEKFLEKNRNVTIYLPASFPEAFKNGLRSSGIKIIEVQGATKICEDVYSTGELGTWMKEQSLMIHTDKGIILITGCAHPGIVKIVTKAKELIRDDVLFVMGGFHLGGMHKSELEGIILGFRKLKVKYVGPCHCSGDLTRQMFKKEYHNNYINVGVGIVLCLAEQGE